MHETSASQPQKRPRVNENSFATTKYLKFDNFVHDEKFLCPSGRYQEDMSIIARGGSESGMLNIFPVMIR